MLQTDNNRKVKKEYEKPFLQLIPVAPAMLLSNSGDSDEIIDKPDGEYGGVVGAKGEYDDDIEDY